jgi:hypothetical protein
LADKRRGVYGLGFLTGKQEGVARRAVPGGRRVAAGGRTWPRNRRAIYKLGFLTGKQEGGVRRTVAGRGKGGGAASRPDAFAAVDGIASRECGPSFGRNDCSSSRPSWPGIWESRSDESRLLGSVEYEPPAIPLFPILQCLFYTILPSLVI